MAPLSQKPFDLRSNSGTDPKNDIKIRKISRDDTLSIPDALPTITHCWIKNKYAPFIIIKLEGYRSRG